MKVKIKLINSGKMPEFKHVGDACCDCYARITNDYISIPSGCCCKITLGFALELPEGYEAVVRPRSGLSSDGIEVSIGTIDSNYRGEIMATVRNLTTDYFHVYNNDRICQLAIRKTEDIEFEQVEELSDTVRGANGFGSTGV